MLSSPARFRRGMPNTPSVGWATQACLGIAGLRPLNGNDRLRPVLPNLRFPFPRGLMKAAPLFARLLLASTALPLLMMPARAERSPEASPRPLVLAQASPGESPRGAHPGAAAGEDAERPRRGAQPSERQPG